MKTMIRLSFLALLLAALPLAAQSYDWSRVGSTGIITDPGGPYSFSGPTFREASNFHGNVTARYPVTNTYGSGTSKQPAWTTLAAAYTDDSANGSLTIRLLQVDKCANTETQICSITSSDDPNPHCSTCTFSSSTFDFANYDYYVEVKLSRTTTLATEELHSLGIN